MSTRKGGLGRNLDSLIPTQIKSEDRVAAERNEVSVELIRPNPKQPRTVFDDDQLRELAASIREHNIRETFSFVTLLIGVNNQYRGRSIENYKQEFLALLNQSIAFAANKAGHVIVLSIPDWGVTPFADGRDRQKVAKEIDEFNAACKEIALANKCQYIEITESTRHNGQNAEYIVADKLHPSAKEYAIWAERLAGVVAKTLKK